MRNSTVTGSLAAIPVTVPFGLVGDKGLYETFAAPTMELIALRGGDEPDTPGTTAEPGPPQATTTGGWRKGRGLRLVAAAGVAWAVSSAIRRARA